MNEYDIEEAVVLLDWHGANMPNARKAAAALLWLKNWTNWNSDGWPYWVKPRRASDSLAEAVKASVDELRLGTEHDIADDHLVAVLRPVKAFLTRQKVDKADRPEVLR